MRMKYRLLGKLEEKMKQNRQLRLILRDLDRSGWRTFPVKRREIDFPIQLDLFARDYSKRAHVVMGLFYELLCTCLFGGKLADQTNIKQDLKNVIVKVDVFNWKRKRIIESKACRSGHRLSLLDDQTERYQIVQSLYPDYEIDYVVWRHTLRGIKSYSRKLDSLIDDLCDKTLCTVILPFSVITKIYRCKEFQRWESEKWDHCTQVHSRFLNLVFSDPVSFFNRISVDNGRFEVEYYETPEISFGSRRVKSMPVAWVKDRDYKKWVEGFVDKVPF